MLHPMHPVSTDPASVAFVVQCFLLGVVSADEVRAWAEHALVAGEDCPLFVEGLAEFDGAGEEIHRRLGFVPERTFSAEEKIAIAGIGYCRERHPESGAPSPEDAAAALAKRPETEAEFRRNFPFLPWGGSPGP